MQSAHRKEYLRQYRERNKEKIREYNRMKYQERKEDYKHMVKDETILIYMAERKKQRMMNMSYQRMQRRIRNQAGIEKEHLTYC